MENVILVIHLILALAIILLVLIQRSEGGGLGIGGGGGGGGLGNLATAQGTASALTKMTAIAAACFFTTSLILSILAGNHTDRSGILERHAEDVTVIEQTLEEAADEIPEAEVPAEVPSVPIGQ